MYKMSIAHFKLELEIFCLNKRIPFKTNKDQIGVVTMVNEIKVSASNWLSKSNTKIVHKARIPYKNA